MNEKHLKLLNEYKEKINQLNNIINKGRDFIEYIPDTADAWSIKSHLSHLVQTQIESVNRTLLLIRNEKNLNYVSNSESWIYTTINYELDIETLLETINSLAKFELMLLSNVPDLLFENSKISCSYKNEIEDLSLVENVESTNWHLNFHIEYMNRNKEAFEKKSF